MTTAASNGALYNTTYDPAHLSHPPVKEAARALSRYARRLFFRGMPFAVNGVLRRRFYIREHKMWEYARGLAYAGAKPPMRVLDFGGGATLPPFYLAEQGCDVMVVDINQRFVDETNAVAAERGWTLSANSTNLVDGPPPAAWGTFDRIQSFCVIEHLPKEAQHTVMKRLASLLRPGGVMVVTIDFGPDAPSEAPFATVDEVQRLVAATGLAPLGNPAFHVSERRFALDKRHPTALFTIGSLFLTTP